MDNGSSVRRVQCPMESVSTTFQSLDTVRALHQTVVSLRAALEEAKSEIQRLRSQITAETEIKESSKQPEKLQTISIEKEGITDNKDDTPETWSLLKDLKRSKEPQIEEEKPYKSLVKLSQAQEKPPTPIFSYQLPFGKSRKTAKRPEVSIVPDISITPHRSKEDSNKMSARIDKIDLKIKVLSNINVDGSSSDASTTNQPGSDKRHLEEKDRGAKIHTKTSATDDVEIKKSCQGSYTVTQTCTQDFSTDDKDDSQSEGDNSIFVEPTKEHQTSRETKGVDKGPEVKEEVDDIELIFSSDENRDPIQEDLVSISEYDPWQTTGGSGTPVLVKFASLPSDQDSAQQTHKEVKIPMSTTCDAFYENNAINFSHEKSLTSTDSFDNHTTNKSGSSEKENSEGQRDEGTPIGRDESLDFFDNRDFSGIGRKWTNCNVLVETDISKCGIMEETSFEMYRRNTCPNPPAYRPIMTRYVPPRLVSRYCRRGQYGAVNSSISTGPATDQKFGPKRSSSAQTDISALPDIWKSESQLTGHRYHTGGQCTLPSKFVPASKAGCPKHTLRISERTQEARRVLLSDINFTSMVPELSRSADHLCQDERRQEQMNKQVSRYYKGNLLKTPDYALKGITPSASMTSPGVSQWTVNESSFGTQTIQTGESWGKRGDSFDSCRSYSTDSRCSGLDPHHRSRSVPSIRCVICKQAHSGHGIRTSESMHYTPRVTFQEPACRVRGSLPDLRHDCVCSRKYTGGRHLFPVHRDSSGSTESLLDEADAFVRKSMDNSLLTDDVTTKRPNFRRLSENDIQRDYIPSKQSLPFLPKTANCLKPGHLAKVISKNGRVVVGRVRYVGPLISTDKSEGKLPDDLYVGVQLQSKCGDCDGTFEGRKIFDCEPLQGLFVPFKKVVMAWTG